MDALRQQGEPVLLVDAGDAVTAQGSQRANEAVLAAMAAGGYAALNVGDEEAAWGLGALRQAAETTGLALVSSNLIERATGGPAFAPELSLAVGQVRVAVLGVIAPGWESRRRLRAADEFVTLDPAAALAQRVARLRAGHDLVVVLAQLRLTEARALVEQVPGIDAVVGGEDRTAQPRSGPLAGALWVQSKPLGKGMMMARLAIGPTGARALGWKTVPFPGGGPSNVQVAKVIADSRKAAPRVTAQAAGRWRYRPDDRPDRPRTLLFCPMQPDYLKDTARHWGRVGFNGFIISVGGWGTDIWARDGDRETRGEDDGYLRQFRAANVTTRQHGGGWNFPKISFSKHLPDWFDDAAWNPIIENMRQYARFARLATSPGFAMDIEYINKQYNLDWEGYSYDGYTQADLRAKVRQRGRQMVGAMLEEFPAMELLVLPEGPVQYGPLCAEWVSGFLEAMAARDAPGGFHLLTEAMTYGCTDPLTLIAHPTQVREIMTPQLSEGARGYWQKRGTIAMGAWPLGYYRSIFDADGNRLGFGGKKDVFGDKVIGSYGDKSENYPPDHFRRQLAAMRMAAPRYVWVYGHGSTWWRLSEEEAKRYGPLGNATLPTVKNLREYEAVVAAREIIDDPALTPAAARLRRGEPADLGGELGFIAEWQLIGPFPNDENEGVSKVFPPEREIDLTASYQGKEGPVRWFRHRTDDPLRAVILRRVFNRTDQTTAYGLVWVSSGHTVEAQLRLGRNDDLVAWWDGQEIARCEGGSVLTPDKHTIPLRIEAGTHTLLLKVCNWGRNWGFIARFTDRQGQPLEGLRCSTQAPAGGQAPAH